MVEIPPHQSSSFSEDFPETVDSLSTYMKLRWEKTEIDPLSIINVAQLGPGIGVDLGAFLKLFANAHFHVVDYYDMLHPTIAQDPRVSFHQGLYTDVLAHTVFPDVDLTILSFISRFHGFTERNAGLLRTLVGDGLLLTHADNGLIESQPWFRKQFSFMKALDNIIFEGTCLWQGV
jgi:hypothetical protein